MKAHRASLAYVTINTHRADLGYALTASLTCSLRYRAPGIVTHRASLRSAQTAQHRAFVSYEDHANHRAPLIYAVSKSISHQASLRYSEITTASHRASLRYAEARNHRASLRGFAQSSHRAKLRYVTSIASSHRSSLTYALNQDHSASLPILTTDPFVTQHRAPLPIYAVQTRDISTTISLEGVPIVSMILARDQDQTYWSADIELAKVADYHRFPIRTKFELTIGTVVHRMVVDRRQLTQVGPVEKRPVIRGLSEPVLLDAPFAAGVTKTWDMPKLASDIVREVLSGLSVTWGMVDWMIPAYRLAVEGMTPMAISAKIVKAAGGVLEAMPDGSVLARAAYPVSVPNFESAGIDATITHIDDIHSVTETLSAALGINRIRVYDTDPNVALNDRLEFEEDDYLQGTVRAYLSPWRGRMHLRHSRGDPVSLEPLGAVSRLIENELVEIRAGAGTTRYPVISIQSAAYEADDLGGITIAPHTTAVRTEIEDYSLLRLDYITQSLDWKATADSAVVAQMILEDRNQ